MSISEVTGALAQGCGIAEAEVDPLLVAEVIRLWEVARTVWPDLPAELVPVCAFARRVGQALDPGEVQAGPGRRIERVCSDDLYLAIACAGGDHRALFVFERDFLQPLRRTLRGRRISEDLIDEAQQVVRTRLLTHEADGSKLDAYRGQGSLKAYVRSMAVRYALDVLRRQGRQPELPALEQAAAISPEMLYLRDRYRASFTAAIKDAILGLSEAQRTLLHLFYVAGMSEVRIAAIYQVAQSTISYRLKRCQNEIHEGTYRNLQQMLQVDRDELDSLMRLLPSQLSLSLRGLLAAAE